MSHRTFFRPAHSLRAILLLLSALLLVGCAESEPADELTDIGATLKLDEEDQVVAVTFPDDGTDEDLKHLTEFDTLRELDLTGSQVTDKGMQTVSELRGLQQLRLGGTQVTEKGLEELTELESLAVLSLAPPPKPEKPEEVHWYDAINLGIDLAGGTNLVYEVDRRAAERMDKKITSELMEQMVGAIGRRLNPGGVKELTVRQVGVDRIEVIVPGADREEVDQIKRQITRIGSLEFAILATRSSNRHQQIIDNAQRLQEDQRDHYNQDNQIIASWRDVAPGETLESVGAGGGVVTRTVIRDGEQVEQFLIVLDPDQRQRVTGQYLTRAYQTQDPNGGLAVGFTFNQQGGRLFGQLTGRHQVQEGQTQYRLAILLDNNVVSAPSLRETIRDSGIITGNFSRAEIDDLVNVLNAGALEVPLQEEPESEFSISPTLGEDVREKGVTAIVVAGGLVVLFMIAYYFVAGAIADLCLVLNVLLVMGAMAFIDAAYTLPGLAGIVLTIGMAVDANVLIFERIREEQERGSSLRMAIHNGFSRALSAIIDSNVTTLITAVILYMIGTDQVRGFAVTLFIGLVASMFTAVFFGRLVFDILERRRWIRRVSMMNLFKVPPIDWVGKRVPALILSAVVLTGGLAAFFARGDDNLDIDFTGGTMLTFEFEEPQNTDEIRGLLREQFDASVTLEPLQLATEDASQGAGDFDESKQFRMRTKNQDLDEVRQQVNEALTGSGHKLLIIELANYEVQPISVEGAEEAPGETQAALPPELRQRFGGGHRVVMEFSDPISPAAVRDNFAVELGNIPAGPEEDAPSKYENPQEMVQAIALGTGDSEPGDDAEGAGRSTRMQLLVTREVAQADLQASLSTLQATMAENPVFSEVNRFESSVATEMQQSAFLAIFFSIVAVIAYLWFRFTRVTFGIAAVVAVVHDVLFTLGMLAVGSYLSETFIGPWLMLEDFKINMAMVAAFLTIVGYSLNDTIVIFDRVREVRGKNPALTAGMVNRAVNQTLSRTILTTLTVFMVVIVLYLFGGEGIHGFAFALVVGLLSGTYSTLFIANPVLLWLMGTPEAAPNTATARTT